ncbi:uncharacterized protein LOC127862143 isoform X2 [Dreissena polymorpha]|uniref:Chitin-binding type-4 domain-containing protein n=2 Tax=Dreissena polymorpha TaxID=45954 RepID=A0A9D4S684_DREPO|nr:uncharacterized protein LOC127862143 isoform X2 [Dreissena polymorpha]XP_052257116.1 uncharacterized protein LOC127862143 isoform X2 [Dreissena polymorpha]XP_052257125.1 uncharacterized protein LOC127862143 isoform X2 [Dreissena polymorpha]KAH3894119.1 hypothetical protein DPMN_018277 [Dreissena polymorpha]
MRGIFSSVLVVVGGLLTLADGHGRLIMPPGRSTMWRYGFNTPHNYDDNQLSCGGYGTQYYRNGGRCGICGDPFDGQRDNEAGGKFATATIAATYTQGQIFTVQLEITVNHGGWFEFRLCPNNDFTKRATQECLDKYLLEQTTGGARYTLNEGRGIKTVTLKLPKDLTCSQCVLQWKWNTASNTRCDGSQCCRGCGPQEQFYGCSDVTILAGNGGSVPQAPPSQNQGAKPQPLPSSQGSVFPDSFIPSYSGSGQVAPPETLGVGSTAGKCAATKEYRLVNNGADAWCVTNCRLFNNCPKERCTDECRQSLSECKAKPFYVSRFGAPELANVWCRQQCTQSICPLEFCEKSCLM